MHMNINNLVDPIPGMFYYCFPPLFLTLFSEGVNTVTLNELQERNKRYRDELKELQLQVQDVVSELDRERVREKAIKLYLAATPEPTPPPPPSTSVGRKFEKISSEIEVLIAQKMFYEGGSMTWEECCKA